MLLIKTYMVYVHCVVIHSFVILDKARYIVELKLLNYDLEEILDDGVLNVLVERVHQLWNTEYHYVTKVN